jgi:hypothetical protein
MFSIQIEMDSRAADTRIAGMVDKIADVGIVELPKNLIDWQLEDMKRQRANIEIQGWSAMTRIWPRSRLSMQKRMRPRFEPSRRSLGLRPILRPILFEALRWRMEGMLNIFITWRR